MEVPLVSTGPAPATGAPAPEASADGPSFDEALAAADAEFDAETVASDSSLAALAALLTLATPAAVPVVPSTPAPEVAVQSAAEAQSLNWALAPTAADPAAASAERIATLTENVTPPAPQAGTLDESAAGLTFAGALGEAAPDAEPAPPPPEARAEAAAPRLRLLRELDDTPIIYNNAPTHEPARLTEAHPTPIELPIPERAALVQVERALALLSDSTAARQSVRVQLQPESLGRIELRVTHGEHGLRVALTAENAATGQLLERRLDDLRQTLVASGVEVSGLSVSVGHGQADPRSFFWQRPAFSFSAAPARAFGDDYGSAAILLTAQNGAHRAALTGVDYRI